MLRNLWTASTRPGRIIGLLTAVGLVAAGPPHGVAAQPPGPPAAQSSILVAECASARVLCVDDDPGASSEFQRIQSAVDRARPGDVVLVFDGDHAGFRVSRGGTAERQLVIRAAGRQVRVVTPAAGTGDGIYLDNSSYTTIEGFVVDGSRIPDSGIAAHDARPEAPMFGLVVRNNVVRGSGSTNIYLSQVADSLIEGNVAAGSRASHGIYLSNAGSDRTTLRGNNCYDNAKNGIHFNGDQADTGDGLQSGLVVDGNIVHHNQANGLNMDGVQDSLIRNNLAYRNGRHALRAYAIDAAAGPRALTIANNTFVDNRAWSIKLTEDLGGHVVFNNILLSAQGSIAVESHLLETASNIVDDAFTVDGERTVLRFDVWQRLGYGQGSRRLGPAVLFEAAAGADFRLRPGSPAIDTGVAAFAGRPAPTGDLLGTPRPSGAAHDVGALEAADGRGR